MELEKVNEIIEKEKERLSSSLNDTMATMEDLYDDRETLLVMQTALLTNLLMEVGPKLTLFAVQLQDIYIRLERIDQMIHGLWRART